MRTYIIIPHYIVSEELKELATQTLESFKKEFKDKVIISVDDGSPMDCTFLKDLSDIYIKNKENSGFAITCNNGFKRAFKELGKEDGYIVCANNDIEVYGRTQEELIHPFNEFDNVAITGICHSREKVSVGEHLRDKRGSKIVDGGQAEVMQDGGLWMSKKSILEKITIYRKK